MRKISALILMALGATGCATTQTKANPNAAAGFQPGVTTIEQAEARLGQPYSVSKTAEASTILAYRLTPARTGMWRHTMFASDTGANRDILVLNFDKYAKFVSSTSTQSTTSADLFNPKQGGG